MSVGGTPRSLAADARQCATGTLAWRNALRPPTLEDTMPLTPDPSSRNWSDAGQQAGRWQRLWRAITGR